MKALQIREQCATNRDTWKVLCKIRYPAQGDGGEINNYISLKCYAILFLPSAYNHNCRLYTLEDSFHIVIRSCSFSIEVAVCAMSSAKYIMRAQSSHYNLWHSSVMVISVERSLHLADGLFLLFGVKPDVCTMHVFLSLSREPRDTQTDRDT